MPASNARQGAVHRFVLPALQEEGRLNLSSKCMMNMWMLHVEKPSKKVFCSWMSSYFFGIYSTAFLFVPCMTYDRGLSCCLRKCHFSLRDSKTQENLCILLLFKTLWFLNLYFSDRLIASDMLITFLTIDKVSEEIICFGLDLDSRRS